MSIDYQEHNIPDENDPQFRGKIGNLVKKLFEKLNSTSKNFPPIQEPQDNKQIGDVYFDTVDHKLKVVTSDGIKIIKYE